MFIIGSYTVAVIFCLVTMLCWGSWANTQKLASQKWPFQLFYWDYVIGVFLFSLLMAFTMGSIGSEGRGFLSDISQANGDSMFSAFMGGVIFNFANILLVIAIDIAGLAVAFPVGIGLALVIGVLVNYIATPSGDPFLLFIGVALVVVAIIIDALIYRRIPSEGKNESIMKGLIFSILAGISMGFFYRFVAASMSLDFANPAAGKMTPYTALVIFSMGVFISNFLWNSINMYYPFSGEKTTYGAYFKIGKPRLHIVGILGGSIWGLGMLFNILAGEKASYAVSYGLGQGATMVSAAWGVFVWKEFRKARGKATVNMLTASMFLLFIVGLGLIILAKA
ncbi:MAG TPA: multidrug DMT transporter permease [Bacteroidetes bacterium]|nr:multidrug DMT transporter permease [Bacteroidota bacterium]